MAYRRSAARGRSTARRSTRGASRFGARRSGSASRGVRSGAQRIRIELVHTTAPSASRPAELIGMKPAEPPATSRF